MTKRTRQNVTVPSPQARQLTQDRLREVRGGQTFQKVEWTWADGGVTASDDWEARV